MNQYNQRGITLIDLMLTISIIGILLGYGLPAFDELIARNKMLASISQLKASLQLGRKIAINEQKKVTVCPLSNTTNCGNNWSDGYQVFVDSNGDNTINENDRLLQKAENTLEDITIDWNAFGNRPTFQWHETGITNHQNGYFKLCYRERIRLSRALIISKSGRIRHSQDSNGNDIHETSSGSDIQCN
ncbi:GspH/FimT family pseudopilin [Aliikangiella sp. G2MR2-5]|uniref:GspH/FimT family pseudopilin n=1 Tax=Aliikangiella sp. G2MR2-5 TaxID=2788943 RepID=UPI0018AA7456|nr:GspH/FimT family pseudopilin [Aliikangiella sp. G2MR2-5]